MTNQSQGAMLAGGTTLTPKSRSGVLYQFISFCRKQPLGAFSLLVIAVLIFLAAFGSQVSPYDPKAGAKELVLTAPSWSHPFGADQAGRDILSRLIAGASVSLYVSAGAVVMGTLSGVFIGVVSGYLEGPFDAIVQRLVDALMSIPLIVIAIMLISLREPSLNNLVIALSIAIAPRASRVARGSALSVKHEQYVEAATAIGATTPRILWRYIVPNIFAPILVLISVNMGGVIVAEASLSFLGLGPPTLISWGGMLSAEGRQFMQVAPWMAIYPGAAIMVTVLAFNLLGDALRDVLDPRLRS